MSTDPRDLRGDMRPIHALQGILATALFGVAFSGALTYRELFGSSAMSCPAPGAPGTIFGYPACVYGLFVFAAIALLAGLGLRGARATVPSASASA
jgi:uncharacterized membrane protein